MLTDEQVDEVCRIPDNVETRDVLQRLLKTLMINFDDVFTQDKIKIIVGKDTGTL